MARKEAHARFGVAREDGSVTRDEAMRRIATLNRESWLQASPGATEVDYQAAAMFGAFGMPDHHWQGSSSEDGPLAKEIAAILAQIEE